MVENFQSSSGSFSYARNFSWNAQKFWCLLESFRLWSRPFSHVRNLLGIGYRSSSIDRKLSVKLDRSVSIKFLSFLQVTEPDNFKGWADLRNRQIDTFPKFTYPLMMLLAQDLHFRYIIHIVFLFTSATCVFMENLKENIKSLVYQTRNYLFSDYLKISTRTVIVCEPRSNFSCMQLRLFSITHYYWFQVVFELSFVYKYIGGRFDLRQVDFYGVSHNGSFDGLVGHLQRREAEVGLASLFMRHDRMQVADFFSETCVLALVLHFYHCHLRLPYLTHVQLAFLIHMQIKTPVK